ncbi:glycosyltransferase [Halioxenophilus sp. WMMB6]|uniref:glycosyltransferase n=1 Tax=Halioxenophilus sp. WMMB6 TaxID=3073815 RepID=UPI00295EB6D0|nr:glycosyltransferase [Halioxenophilus sp. WMMB6]
MNHDVINDRYGRLYELPRELSTYCQVRCVAVDYRFEPNCITVSNADSVWQRLSAPRSILFGWLLQLLISLRSFKAEAIVASSDCLQVVVGYYMARLFKLRFFADLYDDYSTFGLARIPLMKYFYNRALRGADGFITVSNTLAEKLAPIAGGKPCLVLESTIGAGAFFPVDKLAARAMLRLPNNKLLVGVCGGLNSGHGIETIYAAVQQLVSEAPDLMFVIAGKPSAEVPIPNFDNIIPIGTLNHSLMNHFYNAVDVCVIQLPNTEFGYYAFPQKAYEIISARCPAVYANVGALGRLFEPLPEAGYNPDSVLSLVNAIKYQSQNREVLDVRVPTWQEQAEKLGQFILN